MSRAEIDSVVPGGGGGTLLRRAHRSARQAAKLPKMDFFGGADPFVIVRHGAEEVKTKVIKKELNPAWDEKLELKYQVPRQPQLLCSAPLPMHLLMPHHSRCYLHTYSIPIVAGRRSSRTSILCEAGDDGQCGTITGRAGDPDL
eukprot:569113-Rhodomonas_salina.1